MWTKDMLFHQLLYVGYNLLMKALFLEKKTFQADEKAQMKILPNDIELNTLHGQNITQVSPGGSSPWINSVGTKSNEPWSASSFNDGKRKPRIL